MIVALTVFAFSSLEDSESDCIFEEFSFKVENFGLFFIPKGQN
jgi:hypothetical protein